MFASRLLRLVGGSQQHFVARDMTGLGDDELDRALVQAYFIAAPHLPFLDRVLLEHTNPE